MAFFAIGFFEEVAAGFGDCFGDGVAALEIEGNTRARRVTKTKARFIFQTT